MTKEGPAKKVDGTFWRGRLERARSFHAAARTVMELADRSKDAGAAESNMILAAVAYADALTAAIDGVVNQKSHQGVIKAVRAALNEGFPRAQETHLVALITKKDEVQYGARYVRHTDAEAMAEHLNAFAEFVETELNRRFPGATVDAG